MKVNILHNGEWMRWTMYLFLIVSILGLSMRYFFLAEIPFLDYRHILHAHSHLAIIGFGFLFVFGAILFQFLKTERSAVRYNKLFKYCFGALIIMMLAFLYQGYGVMSIAISAVVLIITYTFLYKLLGDPKVKAIRSQNPFLRWSIYWYFISTLGVWAMGPIMIFLGKSHALYHMAVQFFLHFQFNGWFTFAILAILISYARGQGFNFKVPQRGFWILNIGMILTYFLSVTFSNPAEFLFYLNSAGVLLQAAGLFMILIPLYKGRRKLEKNSDWREIILISGITCLIIKVLIQLSVVIPFIAVMSYTIRNFVIGFIHLIMLGSITLTVSGLLLKNEQLPTNFLAKIGWLGIFAAFIITEIVLFGQGLLLWMRQGFINNYYEIIFGASVLFPVSIIFVIASFNKKNKHLKLTNYGS